MACRLRHVQAKRFDRDVRKRGSHEPIPLGIHTNRPKDTLKAEAMQRVPRLRREGGLLPPIQNSTPRPADRETGKEMDEEAMSNAEQFYIYRPTKPIGAIDVREDSLPWVYDQDPSSGFCARMLVVPADALAAADKRIAEEREQHDIMMEHGAEKLAEAERKLAIARQALSECVGYFESWGMHYGHDPASIALVQISTEEK